jgi:hypothetical protein
LVFIGCSDVLQEECVTGRAREICAAELPLVGDAARIGDHNGKRRSIARRNDLVLRLAEELWGRSRRRCLQKEISIRIEKELEILRLGRQRKEAMERCDQRTEY